jgi:chromosome segregation ATPase
MDIKIAQQVTITELVLENQKLKQECDDARSELSLKQQTITITEGTLSDLRKQRDEWSAMCGRYKQERDIAEQDATNYHSRIIELIAERDNMKHERNEARQQIDQYRDKLDLTPINWDI